MPTDTATLDRPLLEAYDAPLHIGAVTLRVNNLAGTARFYEEAIGLARIDGDAETVTLGVDGVPLVTLVSGAGPRRSPAGLFHLALLLPDRAGLADWLAHAADARVPLEGASDHLVSEALYLSDPEGNGIEIYRDRQRSEWPRHDGSIAMATERLDLNALLRDGSGRPWQGMPSGTRMGHIHLRVGETAETERFYGALGFELMVRYPGASFMATGGYHHHLAGNVWGSRGAPRRAEGEAGLDRFELVARDEAAFTATRDRILAAGGEDSPQGPTIADPWGNVLVLKR